MGTANERNKLLSDRLRKVVNYLKEQGIINSDSDLTALTGMHKTTISLALSGKSKVTDKFIEKINAISDKINSDWIYTGNGCMILGENASTDECKSEPMSENLSSALQTIDKLVGMIAEKDRQIGRLIDLLGEKNTAATKDVISAAASE